MLLIATCLAAAPVCYAAAEEPRAEEQRRELPGLPRRVDPVLFGWSWALFYHLCNGIRHLIQDAGLGYEIPQFVRSSWLSVAGSIVLTAATWAWVMMAGGAA